jgi:hypothetical protein
VGLITGADDQPYVVPDFEADADVRKQYDSVAKTLVGEAIADALRTMQQEYEWERLRLEAASRAAQTVLAALERHAHQTRSKYARLVPKQRTASGIVQPPTLFFDLVLSMGAANKYYKQALEAANLKRDAMLKVRSTASALERHKAAIDKALVLRELDVRKRFQTNEGRAELDAHPRLQPLAERCAAIERERADYNERLVAGTVSDEERRDRTMAHDGYRYLDGDLRGLHCLNQRELHFGKLRYLMFRDRDDKIWLVDYANDLVPLAQMRFDVILQNERYLIQRSAPPERDAAARRPGKHTGADPRAYMGVDPALRLALRNFVAREKASL